jgi:hypothetical protein
MVLLILIKVNNVSGPKVKSSTTSLEIVNTNSNALHATPRNIKEAKSRRRREAILKSNALWTEEPETPRV